MHFFASCVMLQPMQRIDGKQLSKKILEQVKAEVELLPFQPVFCDVLVGDDPVSEQYVRMKERRARNVGIAVEEARFPENITTEELVQNIKILNAREHICGLIVQLPLPNHIDTQSVLDAIDPAIDVDILGKVSSEQFYLGEKTLIFPTARAVLHILNIINIDLSNKHILIMGEGKLVGKPVAYLLRQRGFAVSTITRDTQHPEIIMQQADVIISATGHDGLVTGEKVKQGVMIIDAGTSESHGGIVGDVDLNSVSEKATMVSPTPGGVGPVTVAMLLDNVVQVAKKKY